MTALLIAAVLAIPAPHPDVQPCPKTFTRHMIVRAVDAAYRGTRNVTQADRRHLRHYIRCARRHVNQARMRRYLHAAWAAWKLRRNPPAPPLQTAVASYYTTEGTGACGYGTVQTGYRFASLFLACGTRILVCHYGCVVAEMVDHGPYVGGRLFDLNYNLKNAIGCGGICVVRWRLL